MNDCSFEISDKACASDNEALVRGLTEPSLAAGVASYAADKQELFVFFRDENERVIGSVSGETFCDWLHIVRAWIVKDRRGQGLGSQLMRQAEIEAVRRGCHSACVSSGSFEAPGFYTKLGYKEFVAMDDFPIGHQRIGFMKRLAA